MIRDVRSLTQEEDWTGEDGSKTIGDYRRRGLQDREGYCTRPFILVCTDSGWEGLLYKALHTRVHRLRLGGATVQGPSDSWRDSGREGCARNLWSRIELIEPHPSWYDTGYFQWCSGSVIVTPVRIHTRVFEFAPHITSPCHLHPCHWVPVTVKK